MNLFETITPKTLDTAADEPYGNAHMVCERCQATDFRRSRFRLRDLEYLVLLQYPIRCRHCYHRTHTSVVQALLLPKAPIRP